MKKNIFAKLIWDDRDYEEMGWHDSKIYGITFNDEQFELVFDIDYIVKWIEPSVKETYYQFYVVPATLIFRNVYDIKMNLYSVDLRIENIARANPVSPKNQRDEAEVEYDWQIEINGGEISFKSTGYHQFFRKEPMLLDRQAIGLLQRGGVSFTTI